MTLAAKLRPRLDRIRSIPARLGLHPFVVTRITRTYASGTVGRGAYVETTETLLVNGQNPHVRQSTDDRIRQILGSGALFREGEWLVGPLTHTFTGGGYAPDGFDVATGTAAQVLYKITGPGFPASGGMFRARTHSVDDPLRITLVLEPTSKAPTP